MENASMKLVAMTLAVMWLGLFTCATAALADDRDQKIEMLEALLEQYLEENRELKARVEALERSPTESAAAGATTCANDPNKCDDKVLCPLTVNLFGNSYIWSTQPAWIKYVQEAQKRGLDCPASANADRQENLAVWSCETNVSDCTDNDLCELATYGTNTKVWKSGASQKFVDEARKRNLECGVASTSQAPSQSVAASAPTCDNDPSKCSDLRLCSLASFGSPSKRWKSGASQIFVDEAIKRGLDCLNDQPRINETGFDTESDDTVCFMSVQLKNGDFVWSEIPERQSYVQEARIRNLDCPSLRTEARVAALSEGKVCGQNLSACGDAEICASATHGTVPKVWKSGASQKFVDEARKRKLNCGVSTAGQAEAEFTTAGATTCVNDPSKCEDSVLCPLSVTQVGNSYAWSTQPAWAKHVQEAKSRGLSCKVSETANQQENVEQDHLKGEAFLTGVEAYQMGDFAKARKHLLPLAEQGDAQVQHILGLMYQNGWGFTKDYSEAVYWYRQSAEQNYAMAQTAIGDMYVNGFGVKKDMTEAASWFRKAADQGDVVGQISLAWTYSLKGEEGQKESLFWYRKAAEQGNARAQEAIGHMYANGEGVEQSHLFAAMWYQVALINNPGTWLEKHLIEKLQKGELTSSEYMRSLDLALDCIHDKKYVECEE